MVLQRGTMQQSSKQYNESKSTCDFHSRKDTAKFAAERLKIFLADYAVLSTSSGSATDGCCGLNFIGSQPRTRM